VFFTGIGAVSSVLLFAGFAPTFYLRPFFHADGLRPILSIHGVVFTLWLALFVTQTILVATRRTPTHRRFGAFGGAIAVAMVVVGFATAVDSAQQRSLMGESAARVATLFAGNVSALAAFVAFVAGGMWRRRQPELHKRYMALAMVSLLGPGVGRLFTLVGIPVANLAVALLSAFSVATFDRVSQRRNYSVTLWGAGLVLLPFLLVISGAPGVRFQRGAPLQHGSFSNSASSQGCSPW
jgi:hypothetical protein